MIEDLNTYLRQVAQTLGQVPTQPLNRIAEAIWETYERDGTILICGNGGSAASATHFACDLAKLTISADCRRVRALALTDNIALMTAWSNDQAYADVFVEQLISVYRPGDLLFTISGSGNSPNVLRAVEWANQRGAPTVGLTGFDGGKLARLARLSLHVQNDVMPQVEDIHMAICHGLAVAMRRRIADTTVLAHALISL
ncbi:MAG: SIS domain-containing protein [Roseiflexaceae bacterium]